MPSSSKINVFRIRHQIGAQTYLTPEFIGSYRDCQDWLLDKRRDLVSDRQWYSPSVKISSRVQITGYAGLSAWNANEGQRHLWVITTG